MKNLTTAKKKTNRIFTGILGLMILIAALLCIAAALYPKASYAVFKNLTAKKLRMDSSSEWAGGVSYEKIPYASDSENQYLDLYVPGCQRGRFSLTTFLPAEVVRGDGSH